MTGRGRRDCVELTVLTIFGCPHEAKFQRAEADDNASDDCGLAQSEEKVHGGNDTPTPENRNDPEAGGNLLV